MIRRLIIAVALLASCAPSSPPEDAAAPPAAVDDDFAPRRLYDFPTQPQYLKLAGGTLTGTLALSAGGIQLPSIVVNPCGAGKPCLWVDNASPPNLRYEDGTNHLYVPTASGSGTAVISPTSSQLSLSTSVAASATPGIKLNCTNAFGTTGPCVEFDDGGVAQWQIVQHFAGVPALVAGSVNADVLNSAGDGIAINNTNPKILVALTTMAQWNNVGYYYPGSDGGGQIGYSGAGWGPSFWTKNAIGTAQTAGLTAQNKTAAANDAQQYSPMIYTEGQGWNPTAGASHNVGYGLQVRPVQSTANEPTADLVWYANINGTVAEQASLHSNAGGGYFTSNQASMVEGKLATVLGVDLNQTTTKTTLYTVPSGKSAIITKVVLKNASTSLTTASFGLGFDASATNYASSATHTELTGNTLYTVLLPKTGATRGVAADVFGLKPTIAQGVAATVDVDVYGYLY